MAINPNGIATLDVVGNENLVDGLHYKIEFSKVLAQNIFIQLRTRVGQSVTGKYVPNGVKAGHVVVNRVKRPGMKPRTLGLTTNNAGLLNQSAKKAIATDQYHVQLMHVYDNVFQIPRIASTLMPVDLVNETLYNIAGEIYEYIDSSTVATMLSSITKRGNTNTISNLNVVSTQPTTGMTAGHYYAAIDTGIISKASNATTSAEADDLATQNGKTFTNGVKQYKIESSASGSEFVLLPIQSFVELPSSDINYLDAIKSAVKILKKGDMDHGIGMYEPTAILARPDFVMDLLSAAGVVQGGSNFAQLMIAQGTLSPEASYLQYGVGTKGMVLSYPVIEAPDLIFDLAKEWLVGATGEEAFIDDIQALVISDIATVRGIADEYMDVRQSTEVNAVNLLPLYQWGVENFYGTGIVAIVSNGASVMTGTVKVIGWDSL
jgi:hypothetical protein